MNPSEPPLDPPLKPSSAFGNKTDFLNLNKSEILCVKKMRSIHNDIILFIYFLFFLKKKLNEVGIPSMCCFFSALNFYFLL